MPNETVALTTGITTLHELAKLADAERSELIRRFQQALRENVFSNRTQIHPRSLAGIATQEVEFLIEFLRNPSLSGKDHGIKLCQLGLGNQTFTGLWRIYWDFFNSNIQLHPDEREYSNDFLTAFLEGFYDGREKLIWAEQESFRLAFQMELNRQTAEIQEARAAALKAAEANYRNIISTQESERRRISRELHDGTGQSLISIHMSLENILKDSSDDGTGKREQYEKTLSMVENVMQETRALAYSLRPPVLDLLGIHLTVKQLCLDFSEQSKLKITYSGMEFPLLVDELAITIYRVVQEGLSNIKKHAHAQQAWVKLSCTDSRIELIIKDNGQGFDTKIKTSGMGLIGMEERVRLFNGSIKIESSPGKYSKLTILLPLVLKKNTEELSEKKNLEEKA